MKVSIKYFGMIAETVGRQEEVLELNDNISVSELKHLQIEKYKVQDPESVQVAVNQELDEELILKDGDEVAFLPPFAGG